jgi:hypothetical protein
MTPTLSGRQYAQRTVVDLGEIERSGRSMFLRQPSRHRLPWRKDVAALLRACGFAGDDVDSVTDITASRSSPRWLRTET